MRCALALLSATRPCRATPTATALPVTPARPRPRGPRPPVTRRRSRPLPTPHVPHQASDKIRRLSMIGSRVPRHAFVAIVGVHLSSWLACSSEELKFPDAEAEVADADTAVGETIVFDSGGVETVTPPDVSPETTAPETVLCSVQGGFGCDCVANGDCTDEICIEGTGGKVCTRICDQTCPPDFDCSFTAVGGSDPISICVPRHTRLCRPCRTNTDCQNPLDNAPSAACLPAADPNAGSFCATSCKDQECPSGSTCTDVNLGSLGSPRLCLPADGQCDCRTEWSGLKLETDCHVVNGLGECDGVRGCGPLGLSACSADTPAAEECNGKDDNCDGDIDEGSCTIEGECVPANAPNPDDPCKRCLPGTDPFKWSNAPPTTPCEDGLKCTTGTVCSNGNCIGGAPIDCEDQNPCTNDSCNEQAGGCVNVANTSPCNDNDSCTTSDTCANKVCSGAIKSCDDGEVCTNDSCDPQTGCVYVANTLSCDDSNACTTPDTCANKACVAGAIKSCDDGKVCTNDSCDPQTGCVNVANTSFCEDGDSCTTPDTCANKVCVPGAIKSCDDGNVCTTDTCTAATGDCRSTLKAGFCQIEGVCYAEGVKESGNDCRVCDPGTNPADWTEVDAGTTCGTSTRCAPSSCQGGQCVETTLDTCVLEVTGCPTTPVIDPTDPDYKICSFTTPGIYTFTITEGFDLIEITVVGGGGGSFGAPGSASGGGGGGGYKHSEGGMYFSGTSYLVIVGQGGTGQENGDGSSFGTLPALTVLGGGYSGSAANDYVSASGSSGGGGPPAPQFAPGQGIDGQGNHGGAGIFNLGGGGGGAGTPGAPARASAAGNGGRGTLDLLMNLWMGGGGGGGTDLPNTLGGAAPDGCGGYGAMIPAPGGNGVNGRGCGAGGGGGATKGGDGGVYLKYRWR